MVVRDAHPACGSYRYKNNARTLLLDSRVVECEDVLYLLYLST
jgi:hypothetical protein